MELFYEGDRLRDHSAAALIVSAPLLSRGGR